LGFSQHPRCDKATRHHGVLCPLQNHGYAFGAQAFVLRRIERIGAT